MRPLFMTAIRSEIVIASSWSCVTNTKVMPDLLLDALELQLHLLAQLEVERAERLVEQEHLGPVDQRASQRDSLLLTARKLRAPPLAVAGQADQLQRFHDAPLDLFAGHLLAAQAERHVVVRR